ncbi:MAG TPA: L-aspartate oxidase [Candidatus Polarisedimenticolia bacterium]|jgi:L-aspartate oxidase|nr:L-aspartate oxidase [Candidatus Polarisedimenticolia bacterium]
MSSSRKTAPRTTRIESRYDVIIVGSGIAGLRAAVDLAEAGARVAVLTKDDPTDSNTGYAQGGIAVALSEEDKVEFHFQDTLRAGDGLCNEQAVRILVEEGPARIQELIDWGTRFDREGTRLAFGREGAHSRRRVLHAHGDSTGRELVRALLARARTFPTLAFLSRTFSVDLILRAGRCVGLLVLDEESGNLRALGSAAVLLATGGAGRLYRETTNPPQATGDGVAMGYRAGAAVMDLEFVQFHPTALFVPNAPRFLLSEALRGEGALLKNAAGERFMPRYHPDAELAPRDAVCLAIVREIERTGDPCVFLDLTGRDPAALRERFPKIYETCLLFGLDLARDRIPVLPSAHYFMGGVRTDLSGRTSLPGLFAAGEVACTGVHGANRLASNSLLEGLVFGARAAAAIRAEPGGTALESEEVGVPAVLTPTPGRAAEWERRIGDLMWKHAGIRRDAEGLSAASRELERMEAATGAHRIARRSVEARNLTVLGELVCRAALERRESRGSHFRSDFPGRREEWSRHLESKAAAAADLPRVEGVESPADLSGSI